MPPTDTKTVLRYATTDDRLANRRRRIFRSFIALLVASLALVTSIILAGDVRRHKVAMSAAQAYIDQVSQRVGRQAQLPLNLRFDDTPEDTAPTPLQNMEWLTRDQAWLLRRSDARVMAAHSSPIRRRFLNDGGVAVFFQDGGFNLEWMQTPQFEAAQASLAAEIERLERELKKETADIAEDSAAP